MMLRRAKNNCRSASEVTTLRRYTDVFIIIIIIIFIPQVVKIHGVRPNPPGNSAVVKYDATAC